MADARACVAELRVRIASPARTYKANHLLREKHRDVLEWFLAPDGPVSGRARVMLVDKERFLLGTFLGLLRDPSAQGWLATPVPIDQFSPTGHINIIDHFSNTDHLSTIDNFSLISHFSPIHHVNPDSHISPTGLAGPSDHFGPIGPISPTGHVSPTGPISPTGHVSDTAAFLNDVNDLLRGRLGHEEFGRRSPAWLAGHADAVRAIAIRQARRNPNRIVIDPLFWAITRTAHVWGESVAVVHDRHLSLTPSRIAALVAAGGLGRFEVASAQVDPRVQLADFLAGIVRRTFTAALDGAGDPALLDLVQPYLAISL